MKKTRRPQDWNAAEKVQAVIEFEKLEPSKQGEFLRIQGLQSDHITQWKAACVQALEGASSGQQRAEVSQLKAQNKELERNLRRKDKALAETAALLILKKKADLIWGTEENE